MDTGIISVFKSKYRKSMLEKTISLRLGNCSPEEKVDTASITEVNVTKKVEEPLGDVSLDTDSGHTQKSFFPPKKHASRKSTKSSKPEESFATPFYNNAPRDDTDNESDDNYSTGEDPQSPVADEHGSSAIPQVIQTAARNENSSISHVDPLSSSDSSPPDSV
ncbi:hypothetical protein BGX27_005187 [Mortierella sp. AM989]|nr:hypothetical protein BGX27_005187 [Mortierella sp. AM989]